MFKSTTIRTARQLRPSLPLRTFRLIAQKPTIRHESNIAVQRVRFKQRFFTWRRFASAAIYTSAAVFWYDYVFGLVDEEVEDDEEEEAEHAEEAGEQEDGDDDEEGEWEEADEEPEGLFIPLGFAKPRPRTFYRGSDPEWQEFRKLAPDTKKHTKMREQLVSIVRSALANDPRHTRRLGQVDITAGKHWLDITFPDGPPIEYERRGLEISDEGIAITTRPINQRDHARLKRALWPEAAFSSVYATASYIVHLEWHKMKQLLGLVPSPDEEIKELQKRNLQIMQQLTQLGAKPPPGHGPAATDTSQRVAPPAAGFSDAVIPSSSSSTKDKNIALPEGTSPANLVAISIFAHTLARTWKPLDIKEAPRGTVIVSGLIEVKGSKARVTVDVNAAYDPKQDKYVIIKAGIRRLQDKHQRPLGGP